MGAEFRRNWRPGTGINSAVSQCWITHWSGIILVNNLLSLVFLPPVSLPVYMLVGLSTWRQTLYWSGKPPTLFLPCYISYITVVIKSWYRQSFTVPVNTMTAGLTTLSSQWWVFIVTAVVTVFTPTDMIFTFPVNIMAARITTFSLQ